MRGLLSATILLFGCATLAGSPLPAKASQTTAPAASTTQAKPPAFETVSIHLNHSGYPSGLISLPDNTDTFTATNAPFDKLVAFAFDFRRTTLIFGAPPWAKTERYDIVAKMAPADLAAYHALSLQDRKALLKPVLMERCHMQAHIEPKEVQVYFLEVAKGGSKLKQPPPGEPGPVVLGPDGKPTHEEGLSILPGRASGGHVPVSSLAMALSNWALDRPVVDQTGLTGIYDFTLEWTPDTHSNTPGADADNGSNETKPGIYTAIQEQLGLRLRPGKMMMDALVIDSIERPTEN